MKIMFLRGVDIRKRIRHGGKEIASKLAKELGIHCYENRILTLASQLSGLDEQLFEEVNEKIRAHGGFSSFLKGLPRAKHYIARNEKFVSDDTLFEYEKQIIENLADTESCVIVGKCADWILRGRPNGSASTWKRPALSAWNGPSQTWASPRKSPTQRSPTQTNTE